MVAFHTEKFLFVGNTAMMPHFMQLLCNAHLVMLTEGFLTLSSRNYAGSVLIWQLSLRVLFQGLLISLACRSPFWLMHP